MRPRRQEEAWGLKKWSLLFTTIGSVILILTTIVSWLMHGRSSIDHYVDGRAETTAKKVVADTMYTHRMLEHHRGRR